MKINIKKYIIILILSIAMPIKTFAAVGCDLNDPDRDVKKFFPNSTGYKTEYKSIKNVGGNELLDEVETRLGDKFSGLYEVIDVPYTIYTIVKDNKKIGYIHGVNQKGKYGAMQVFLIFDTNGTIKNMYFQKLTSRASKEFKSKDFTNQFLNLNINDFDSYDVKKIKTPKNSKISKIKNPLPNRAKEDFDFTMRGVKKNLILMDVFIFNPHRKNKEGK